MCEEISWFQALETCVPSAGAGRACAMKIKRDVLKVSTAAFILEKFKLLMRSNQTPLYTICVFRS